MPSDTIHPQRTRYEVGNNLKDKFRNLADFRSLYLIGMKRFTPLYGFFHHISGFSLKVAFDFNRRRRH
jgi:hypothetical protein